jgi:stearoyl-CoA desaturase (delta-9 desaturase)
MSKIEKAANLVGIVVPFLGVIAAVALLWQRWVDAADLTLLATFYLASALGITVGFHRLLTHSSFQTHQWIERAFAVLGSLLVQGSVLDWVADHRKHHAHTDVEGDPHSPHVGHGSGLRGLWHAHVGWLTETQGQADWRRYARDLYDDPQMRRIGRRFPLWAGLSLLLPTIAGFALHGFTIEGAIRGLLRGGLVRIFLVHHATWSVNSACHFFGSRRFDVEDHSTNLAWLAVPSLDSPGTTTTTHSHVAPSTDCHGGSSTSPRSTSPRSTSPRSSSPRWSASVWLGTWYASPLSARPRASSPSVTAEKRHTSSRTGCMRRSSVRRTVALRVR